MKLSALMKENTRIPADTEISGITCDSRQVRPGFLFVCINGTASDGHLYAADAVAAGAAVVVAERDLGLENQILVKDSREVYSALCAKWFGNPADQLHLIGVTGTNGKTSVTYMLKSVLESAGCKVGLIGTIQNMIGSEVIASHNTTPSAYELHSLFALMKAKGCTYVIMEVSSHALDQNRVYQLSFDVAIFTNLTQDHLDYHKTMEKYMQAKQKLFRMCKKAVVNSDDPFAAKMVEGANCEVVTYSLSNNSDYCAKGINYKPAGVSYELVRGNTVHHIDVKTGGRFTVYNSLCAVVAALEVGISMDAAATGIAALTGVKGRAEAVETGRDFTVIIDYAHTPDGLKNILSTFRECEKNRLVVLFGCGGDRDKGKRPVMGSIAVHNADYVIVTSDNPRTEDPEAIIRDILVGMEGTNTPYKVIPDRVEAIRYAVRTAQKGDIIVLAGKGHETYQILKDKTIHLDEREVVAQALSNL